LQISAARRPGAPAEGEEERVAGAAGVVRAVAPLGQGHEFLVERRREGALLCVGRRRVPGRLHLGGRVAIRGPGPDERPVEGPQAIEVGREGAGGEALSLEAHQPGLDVLGLEPGELEPRAAPGLGRPGVLEEAPYGQAVEPPGVVRDQSLPGRLQGEVVVQELEQNLDVLRVGRLEALAPAVLGRDPAGGEGELITFHHGYSSTRTPA
jgi:hypothetical protein